VKMGQPINRLSMHIPVTQPDGSTTFLTRHVQETGVFINDMKIPKAPAVASSVSRGLVRCLARMLGYGLEFYEKDNGDITPQEAWNTLWSFAQNQGVKEQDDVVAIIKKLGITQETLVDRFEEAWSAVSEYVGSKKAQEPVPTELAEEKDEPASTNGKEPVAEENWIPDFLRLKEAARKAGVLNEHMPLLSKASTPEQVEAAKEEIRSLMNMVAEK